MKDSGYTAEELQKMTVKEIKETAVGLGYSIKKTVKKEIVEEFSRQQEERIC